MIILQEESINENLNDTHNCNHSNPVMIIINKNSTGIMDILK